MSVRRLVENELAFRQPNEKVVKGIEKLDALAKADGQKSPMPSAGITLQFYCECSDENCRRRIGLNTKKYRAIHSNRNQFILLPGHDVPEVERTVRTEEGYVVVEKYLVPDDANPRLSKTDVDNS